MKINSIIESTGSYIPEEVVTNQYFLDRTFTDVNNNPIAKSTEQIVTKLEEITQIHERRYEVQHSTANMATMAAKNALDRSAVSLEEIDGIIIAHNFGDIQPGDHQGHLVPNMAARVKHELGIRNSHCFAYDVLYGCPGWLLGLHQAHHYIQSESANAILVIGVESLSRVVDSQDIDSMLFGDGAGAVVVTSEQSSVKRGILGYDNHTDCMEEVDFLKMSRSRDKDQHDLFIQMVGRSVFKYGVNKVPIVISELLQRLSIPISDISTFLFHQANGKMLHAIGEKLSQTHGIESIGDKSPMTLDQYGNTSVASIPTMMDLISKGELPGFEFNDGDKVVMASVGAGMHANSLVYQF